MAPVPKRAVEHKSRLDERKRPDEIKRLDEKKRLDERKRRDERRKDVRVKKAEKEKNAAAKKQDLTSLNSEVEALEKADTPEKKEEYERKSKELEEINKQIEQITKEKEELEAEEEKMNEMDWTEDNPEVSSAAQDIPMQGGDNGGGDTLQPTRSPSDEEDEMPVMTVSDYKSLMGRPSTDREVVAWKPGGGRRGDMVITRYGPKSHPMFRIERASEVDGFDSDAIPDITNTEPKPYRIGERKVGRKWCYDYKHVDGIVAVAYTPRDDDNPLETMNPAWYARHPKKRYAETQILIQWKNISGEEGKKPRTWETRTTARRVCPMRGKKGEADKMFYERAKECETKYAIWLGDNSTGRDVTMTPAPLEGPPVKLEVESEAEEGSGAVEDSEVEVESSGEEAETTRERRSKSVGFKKPSSVSGQPRNLSHAKRSSLKSSKSIGTTKMKEKNTLPAASPAPDVSAPKGTKATSAPPLNKEEWLESYCELYGPKEEMDEDTRVKMINAWMKAKKAAASA